MLCRVNPLNETSKEGRELTSRGDFLTSGCNANNDTLAPAFVTGFERSAHDADVAGAVKGVVTASVGQLEELVDNGLTLGQLGGVHKVGSTELSGPLLLGRVDVDDDDLAGALGDGTLDDAQADAASAEDGNVAARLYVGRDAGGTVARRDTTAQQARAVHRGSGLHGHDRDVSDNGVLAEG